MLNDYSELEIRFSIEGKLARQLDLAMNEDQPMNIIKSLANRYYSQISRDIKEEGDCNSALLRKMNLKYWVHTNRKK